MCLKTWLPVSARVREDPCNPDRSNCDSMILPDSEVVLLCHEEGLELVADPGKTQHNDGFRRAAVACIMYGGVC